jgi:hypothetical protein
MAMVYRETCARAVGIINRVVERYLKYNASLR